MTAKAIQWVTASIPRMLIAAGLAVLLVSACGLPKPRRGPAAPVVIARLSGTLTYRQRVTLAPGSTIIIQLQDVTRTDVPAHVVSQTTIATKGEQVPIAFQLPYDVSRIQNSHSYSVAVRIFKRHRLLFVTDTQYRVITNGAPMNGLNVVLAQAP